MKNQYRKWIDYFSLIVFFSIFMLFFASTTSPLFDNNYGWDSAYFRFIGTSILNGKTPYMDVWDNKGPVFYFIQAIGALNGTQNRKLSLIFIMETISFIGSIILMYQTDQLIHPHKKLRMPRFLLLTVCALPVFISKGEHTNITEEWSIPMICCSLYLFSKYAVMSQNHSTFSDGAPSSFLHPKRYAFYHGICFALVGLIRINNAITICAGLLVIGITLILKKQWKNLFENILFGLLGIAIVTLPVFFWYYKRHALNEMLYSVFTYNLKYMNQNARHALSRDDIFLYLPLIISFILVCINYIRYRKILLSDIFAFTIITANTVLLLNQNKSYYFIIVFPVLLFSFILYAQYPRIPEILLPIVCFAALFPNSRDVFYSNFLENEHPFLPTVNNYLPKSERDSIIAIDIPPTIYLIKGMFPCSRFAAYQSLHFSVEPKFREEFLHDLESKKPKWIITSCDNVIPDPDIRDIIDTEYTLKFNDSNNIKNIVYLYCFYRLNEAEN